jgi:hypothetical protein
MHLMFLSKPPVFDQLLGQLRQAEAELSAR